MPESRADIATTNATRYIAQLCKHFGHKVDATYEDNAGKVDFGFGRLALSADAAQLTLDASADDAAGLTRVKEVTTDHLARFAWREDPKIEIVWA